uniref:Transmembrane protein putative n=1 Tax=Albugo laibachii Nc14 TaxID=890382 RepID=F0WR14_9STRA|nr:transmembrane protein putative [Albugo laibachii Nc14]|eukprot:CCA23774.1 transmembrane protein putative [Albugo laibachii Nc14]
MQRNATLPREALKETNMDTPNVISLASVIKYPSVIQYDRLPPLNPDDLHLPPPPPSFADKTVHQGDTITIGEIFQELYHKTKEIVLGSTLSDILSVMRCFNYLIAMSMIALCIVQIVQIQSVSVGIGSALSIVYTILFALLLFMYEMRTESADQLIRVYFGFMYNPFGRCLFLIMISIFPVGMLGVYGVLVSVMGFLNAYFNFFVITKHPSFTRGVPEYQPPPIPSSRADTRSNKLEL